MKEVSDHIYKMWKVCRAALVREDITVPRKSNSTRERRINSVVSDFAGRTGFRGTLPWQSWKSPFIFDHTWIFSKKGIKKNVTKLWCFLPNINFLWFTRNNKSVFECWWVFICFVGGLSCRWFVMPVSCHVGEKKLSVKCCISQLSVGESLWVPVCVPLVPSHPQPNHLYWSNICLILFHIIWVHYWFYIFHESFYKWFEFSPATRSWDKGYITKETTVCLLLIFCFGLKCDYFW